MSKVLEALAEPQTWFPDGQAGSLCHAWSHKVSVMSWTVYVHTGPRGWHGLSSVPGNTGDRKARWQARPSGLQGCVNSGCTESLGSLLPPETLGP